MIDLEIHRLMTTRSIEELEPEWWQLWERCPAATPFQSPDWLLPWWRHLGGGELLVMTLRREGILAGLAPLFIHQWQGRRQISPIGVSFSDYNDWLLEPETAQAGTTLVLAQLVQLASEWEICILPDLPAGSPLLKATIPQELRAKVEPLEPCPVLALPATVDEFESGLTGHQRRNLGRAQRLLELSGGGQIEQAGEETLSEFVDALFELHHARWQARDEPGVLADPIVQAFHREATCGLAKRGLLRMYGLRLNGTIRSVMYDFASRRCVYAYLSGFDPLLERVSPGTLLTCHAIQEAIREGLAEYDFMRGAESHKYVWGARDRQNYRLTLERAE